MRILFDQGTPAPLKEHLPSHQVETAFELGWSRLTNGELLAAAEGRFDVFVTTDQNFRYQRDADIDVTEASHGVVRVAGKAAARQDGITMYLDNAVVEF
jgi:hypothetical protein